MENNKNLLQVFDYCNNKVRIILKDGESWFVLKDVCDVLGLSNSRMIASRLDEDDVSITYLIDNLGRQQQTNIINENGLYDVILLSRKPEAKQFKRWITHDVLPSIRRHGAYITTSKLEEIAADPESLIRLINSFREENRQLQLQIENDRAKVLFADAITTSQHTLLVGELSKILQSSGIQIGPNRLFRRLRQDGFLMKRRGSSYNSPTQKSMKLKLFSIRETATIHSDGHVTISKTVKVTGKGQIYFVNRFLGKSKFLSPTNDNQQHLLNFLKLNGGENETKGKRCELKIFNNRKGE
jgi:anti-repressor protein